MKPPSRVAFEIMVAYGITSLPILDETNKACGVISATDIFYACQNKSALEFYVTEYVCASRNWAGIKREATQIIACALDDTLLVVLQQMLLERIHHIYVIENGVPVGVVSFVDVIRLL